MSKDTQTIDNSIYNEMQELIKNNKIFRFGLELTNTHDEDRIKQIQNIIAFLEKKEDKKMDTQDKITKMFNDLDIQLYKQPWNKLKEHYKETKIKEYVNEKYKDHEEKDLILALLLEKLEEGSLKTIKSVTYDQKTAKITDIKDFTVDEDGKYSFSSKKTKKAIA